MTQGTQEVVLLNGVTVDTTSAPVNVEGYSKIGVQFVADVTSGNGVFTLEGTIDGKNWVTLPMITVAANTNVQNLIRVLSVTLSSDTSNLVFLDPHLALKAIRAKVDMTTDGTYTAILIAST